MSDKKRWIRLAVAAGLGAAAGAWTYQIQKDKKAEIMESRRLIL